MAAARKSTRSRTRKTASTRSRSRSTSRARSSGSSKMIRIRLKPVEVARLDARDRTFMERLRKRAEGLANASGKTVAVFRGQREVARATPGR